MKKLILAAFAVIALSAQTLQAQACLQGVPDPTVWGTINDFAIGFTIDTDPNDVDTSQVVQGVDTVVYIQYLLPKRQAITSPITGTATVTSITILGVSGLPIGMAWSTDAAAFANNNTYNPQNNRFGCVSLCGETFAAPGVYTIVVNIQGCGSLSGISACDGQTTNLYLEVLPGTGSGPIQMSPPVACDSATVQFNTSLASPDPILFPVSYSWLFHDGTTAVGKPVSKNYTTPGDYPVKMTTTIFEYYVSRATISATGGWTGDIEELTNLQTPELYLQINGGNGLVTTSTASSGTNKTFNNLNVPITSFAINVTGWDEDNGAPFGSADDNLGTATTSFTALSPGLVLGFNASNFSGTITIQQQINTVLENWDTVRIRSNSVASLITASNGFELCTGENTILDAGAGFDYYQWYNENGSILNQNAQTLSVSSPGNYLVEILEAGSICPSFSDTTVVNIANISASNIEAVDGFIYVANPNNYDVQWYLDSVLISGETNDTLSSTSLAIGALTVSFMSASGCEALSSEFSICFAGSSSSSESLVSFTGDVAKFTAEDFVLTSGNAVAWAFSTEADGPITDMVGLQFAIAAGLVVPGTNDTLLNLACSDVNLDNGNYYATPFTAQSVNIDTSVAWNPFDVACMPEINLCIGLSGTGYEINPLLMVLPTGDTIDVIEVLAAGVVPAGTPINSGLWALATSQLGDPACLELVSMLGFGDNPNGTWQILIPNTGTGALNISLTGMNVTVDVDSCSQIANDLVYNIPSINETINGGSTQAISFNVDLPQPPPANFPSITSNCGVIGDAVMFTVYCTDTASIDTTGTPIKEINLLAGLNIYPNPTTGNFKIDFEVMEAGTYQVSMFDLLGRMVSTQNIALTVGNSTLPMNASDLNKGLYHLVIRSKGQQKAFKVLLK
jgi:hypothetical protein